MSAGFLVRAGIVAVSAYLFFGCICTPLVIRGKSMEPAYFDGGFNFCWSLRYSLSDLRRHNVVFIRLAGPGVLLMKRVVALEGEEVEFRGGALLVDGRELREPYIRERGDWDLPPRKVEKGCVYVVGDNRRVPIAEHYFGQTRLDRIAGRPLW